MSYFLVSTGPVPSIDDLPGLRWVRASAAQPYVARSVAEMVSEPDRAVTYLLDDGTLTSDTVVGEAGEQIFGGSQLGVTRLGRVVTRLMQARCGIRVWWPPEAGGLPGLDEFDDPEAFVAHLVQDLRAGRDLNCSYRPPG